MRDPNVNADTVRPEWEPWPDNMPLEEQVERLGRMLMSEYPEAFDRSEGAIEKAARLLFWAACNEGRGELIDGSGSADAD